MNTTEIGKKGEQIAKMFLVKRGFCSFEANFRRKSGEIDIVAHETLTGALWFFEVKAITVRSFSDRVIDDFRPEDRVDRRKLAKIYRTIELFLLQKGVSQETEWRLGVVTVLINQEKRVARVSLIPVH